MGLKRSILVAVVALTTSLQLLASAATAAVNDAFGAGGSTPDSASGDALSATEEAQERFRVQFLKDLAHLQIEEVFYLDPSNGTGTGTTEPDRRFQGWPIVSRAGFPSDTAASATMRESLAGMLLPRPAWVALCINPRHGLRVTMGSEHYDIVVCFECSKLDVQAPNGYWLLFHTFPKGDEAVWDWIFSVAGLTRLQE